MSNKNTQNFISLATEWVEKNDPALFRNNAVDKKQSAPQIFAATPEDSTGMASTSAVVIGTCDYQRIDNEMRNAIENAKKMKAVANSGDDPVEVFKKYPLLGCTTVLDMARIASGYDPNGDVNANKEKYKDYVARVLESPFFHLVMNTQQNFHRDESSWDTAINQISDLFDGVTAKDKSKISQSIKNLTNAVSSKKNMQQGTTLFSVSALNSDEHTVEAYIYSSNISMIENKSKGSDCKQTDIDIYKTNLSFDTEMWQYYAEMVYAKHLMLITDWLNENSTQPGPEPTNLCIGGYVEI